MVTTEAFIEMALSLEEAIESPHFDKTSFRVRKKIFATLDRSKGTAVLKLSEVDQSVFCAMNPIAIFPVPGAWGKKGWTTVDLAKVNHELLTDALITSYCQVAPEKLAEKHRHMPE